MINRLISFILIFVCFQITANAIEKDTNKLKPKYGVFGNYGLGFNFASFDKLPNTQSCCTGFNNSISPLFTVGGLVDIPLDYEFILSFRAGYSQYSGYFNSESTTSILIDGIENIGVFEYKLNSTFNYIDFSPTLLYRFEEDFFFKGGLNFGLLTGSDFRQWEEIKEPSDRGVFPGEGRVRNDFSGEVEDASGFLFGFTIGAEYQFPMNKSKSLFLVPEISYTQNFIPQVSGLSWYLGALKGGLAIKYRQPPPPPPPPPPPAKPLMPDSLPLPVEPPVVEAFVDAVAIDSSGRRDETPDIRIEDFVSLNMRPLLNYIFFDEGSSKIPQRYNMIEKRNRKDFNLKSLSNKNAIETYYDVLNIVGQRLREDLSAEITLVGCNADIGIEKDSLELSKQRALSVKNYLTDVWNIDSNRINIEARNLPQQASKSDTIPGQEENRRVEILSDDDSIIQPVITTDTLRKLTKLDIQFFNKGESEVGIKEWEFQAAQGEKVLLEKSGTGDPQKQIKWVLRDSLKNMPRNSKSIVYSLQVVDSLEQKAIAKDTIYVEQLTVDSKRLARKEDKEFEYYSLILFSYGKSALKQEHREVVDFVKKRITDDAKVYVYGYSDSMGDTDINKRISENRAKSVANRLRLRDAVVEGKGEENLLYDNDLPEGRFYCRTVQITVETPVKETNRNG